MNDLTRRIGNFFLTLGTVMLALFFLSDYTDEVQLTYLLFGSLAMGIGIWLVRRARKDTEPPQRFRLMRRLFGRKQDSEDKDKQR